MPNRWTEFVRDFANRNNLTYGCAMSKPECKAQYHKKYPKPLTKKQQKEREGQENIRMSLEDVNVARKPKKKRAVNLIIEEDPIPKKVGRKAKYTTDEERKQAKREQTLASNKRRYQEKKAEKEGMGIVKSTKSNTYKNKFNKKYGFDKDVSHSIKDIAKITGLKVKGLKTIYNKGIGAYHTNPQSVRPHIKSPEEWAMARIYSAVMGGKAEKIDSSHLIEGDGILKDIQKGIKTAGRKVANTYEKAKDVAVVGINKATEIVKDKVEDVKEYGKAIAFGRNDYPPKVRNILKKYGAEVITSYKIKRTPVNSLLTSALSAVSLGEFGKRFRSSEYDDLFHLFLEMTTSTGKRIAVEKNEVINMEVSPKKRDKEEVKDISNAPQGLTLDTIMEATKAKMGDKRFFGYSAKDNNCQDFIVAVLQSNNIGDQSDITFVKQDTKELFRDLPFLRKFSNTLTTIGARANVATTGAGVDEKELIISSKKKISHNNITKMPKFVKGSQEAKDQMAKIRGMRGGSILPMGVRPIDAAVYKSGKSGKSVGMGMKCPNCDCEMDMEGGKVNIDRAFKKAGRTIKKTANKAGDYITDKKGGLATDLIQYGIPAASSALLGGLATAATGGNPVAGVAASALGSKLGSMGAKELQKKTGTGMGRKGRFVKGSQEAKDYMASIRKKK